MAILAGGEVIIQPLDPAVAPNPAVEPVIWQNASCTDRTRYYQQGLIGRNSTFSTHDVIVSRNVYTSLYHPDHGYVPPTASDYEVYTIGALRHSASRIALNFAVILFWAQTQETVNGKLTYVQPILEQVRREYIVDCFNCIRDEISGSFLERLRAVIIGTPKNFRNQYSKLDSLKISTVLALFNAEIWSYCAAADSIVRLGKSRGLAATVRAGCDTTLNCALDAVNQLEELNGTTIRNVRLKDLFALTRRAIEAVLTHPVQRVTSTELRGPRATDTTTGGVLARRLVALFVDYRLNLTVLPYDSFVHNTLHGPRPVREVSTLGNAVANLKRAVHYVTAADRILCNPSISIQSGLDTVNQSGRQTVILGSFVAKRKGISVAKQNAESEFGTDGSGLTDKPNPNENNSYQTDSDCDTDDEESQGPLKRANFGYWP